MPSKVESKLETMTGKSVKYHEDEVLTKSNKFE